MSRTRRVEPETATLPRSTAPPPALEEAFAYCGAVTRAHAENFPVGSHLVGRRMRPYVHSVYAYARTADDYADEPAFAGRRLDLLDAWEGRLDRCLDGRADHPVFLALGETIRRFALPDRPLRDLLDAFRQDCRVSRYGSWDELLEYCRRSADPVGRIVLHLFGHRREETVRRSDALCTALQLTNFWQDVAVDFGRDRVYLPLDERVRHGVSEEQLAAGRADHGFRSMMEDLVGRTRRLYHAARPLLGEIRGGLGMELRLVWLGGSRILDRIERNRWDVLRQRPTLSRWDKARLLGQVLGGARALR